jgi:hypothetical protein
VCRGQLPQGNIQQLLDDLEGQVRRAAQARYGRSAPAKLSGGLANVRGDWLEYILGVVFWNTVANSQWETTAILRLPSNTQLEFRELYDDQSRGYLTQLFQSLDSYDIRLTMSNPDFICVTDLPKSITDRLRVPIRLDMESFALIENSYQKIRGMCHANSIPFAMTVKTSVRPDRRYQIVHEANVVKALVAHLGSRFWNRELYTAFYAMVANRVSESDRRVLRNPATHTLTQVSWKPVPLVDGVYEIDSVEEVVNIVKTLLDKHLGTPAT